MKHSLWSQLYYYLSVYYGYYDGDDDISGKLHKKIYKIRSNNLFVFNIYIWDTQITKMKNNTDDYTYIQIV